MPWARARRSTSTRVSSKCCANCNFSFSGLYTCDDVKKDCDPVCKKCVAVMAYSGNKFKCTDTFLGICGPKC
ncbi:hypothetical protein PAHAL_5G461300 [Panicum hallii]|uniref:Bowman-Birk serine protease inhibitors family domain-containing protein n=1 Tax=Panicum hallii TaxID=206008 RepID=A0A2T8INH0_9POAL|nr:hypothetical protein PAHAL_5G461300 [Panicum hallii]